MFETEFDIFAFSPLFFCNSSRVGVVIEIQGKVFKKINNHYHLNFVNIKMSNFYRNKKKYNKKNGYWRERK